jgi:leader peptidase (prepilin peptidase) / N-methyltransferase
MGVLPDHPPVVARFARVCRRKGKVPPPRLRDASVCPYSGMNKYGRRGHKFQAVVITKRVIYAGGKAEDAVLPMGLLLWIGITLVLTGVLGVIARVDLRTFRIPDGLSIPLILGGFIVGWLMPILPLRDHLIGAVVGFGLFAVIGEIYFRRWGAEGLGLGDAKLFGAAGAWLGWQALPSVLLIAALGGLGFALLRRDGRVAFGPWLALGFWLVWLWQTGPQGGW